LDEIVDFSRLHDKKYRMNNLYKIVDRDGNSIKFTMTDIQEDVFDNMHNRNLILKARQLGMSTFSVLYLLDEAIFNFNRSCGIVSYSLQHAQHIFKRIIGHAIDHLPLELQPVGITQRSAHEITFSNGSFLRVDTTLRGGTCQVVLVSEFGKTCARSPQKSEEIITGTLQSVAKDGKIIIESTAEGSSGYYADMITEAASRGNDNLSLLAYKLFFYPWYIEKKYSLEGYEKKVDIPDDLTRYFDKLESDLAIEIDEGQRQWYTIQKNILGQKIKQEFPSTITESFTSTSEAYYYSEHIAQAHEDGRILNISNHDSLLPTYVAMDIGVNDLTAIIFFQLAHGEIRIIDYYEDNKKGVDFYVQHITRDAGYNIHTIYLPHDAGKMDGIVVENTYERDFRRLLSGTSISVRVLKRTSLELGISHAQSKFARCVINGTRCAKLLEHLGKYRRKWCQTTGRFLDIPLHDIHSNAADSYRYLCSAVNSLEAATDSGDALEQHRRAVEGRRSILA
jgi:hypothetical protein